PEDEPEAAVGLAGGVDAVGLPVELEGGVARALEDVAAADDGVEGDFGPDRVGRELRGDLPLLGHGEPPEAGEALADLAPVVLDPDREPLAALQEDQAEPADGQYVGHAPVVGADLAASERLAVAEDGHAPLGPEGGLLAVDGQDADQG